MTDAPRSPEDVLEFWFDDGVRPFWFKKSDEIDARIAARFGPTHDAAHAGRLAGWRDSPRDALALAIVLDQFPRNMFRGQARAFASNDAALDLARHAVDRGFDAEVAPDERQFFYLPFMHSEDLADQTRSVALYEALGNAHSLHFARDHRDIIARFGRFPHRNAALGRRDTPEEIEFMKNHQGF